MLSLASEVGVSCCPGQWVWLSSGCPARSRLPPRIEAQIRLNAVCLASVLNDIVPLARLLDFNLHFVESGSSDAKSQGFREGRNALV